MYNFIRKDLKIPFYCGQNGIDTWLNQILSAIQTREIEEVLEEIFTPALQTTKSRDNKENGVSHISHIG